MKLTKWDPLREMEDIFDRYGRGLSWPRRGSQETMATGDWAPRVDISETAKEFNIKVEIPEVKKDDVKVTVENGVLTIRGERKQEKEEKDEKFHRIERSYGSFTRSFTLPDNVNESRIDASFKDGMLYLQVPKTEEAKPKAIEVKVKS
jgi:HSP20 family protein